LTATIFGGVLGFGLLAFITPRLLLRLQLSRAKHRSLAGHAKWSRRLARLIPFYEYDEATFFRADDAPQEVAEQRQAAFQRMSALYEQRFAKTVRQTQEVQDEISDLQFTGRYRVPFQFSRFVRRHLNAGSFVVSSHGATTTDLDGNQRYDLTGSYGVTVFGYDFKNVSSAAAPACAS
jgi:glutamate-1-semialdehyde 2,1-aminomutase